MHRAFAVFAHADRSQRRADPLAHRGIVEAKIKRAEGDILEHIGGNQLAIRILKDQPDAAA